jgi:hypothetical protein
MTIDDRVVRLEQAFATLVRLAEKSDERLDQHLSWVNQLGEAQANSGVKIATLPDAQIRTEEALARLAASQAHIDQRLDALIEIVREGRNGPSTNR